MPERPARVHFLVLRFDRFEMKAENRALAVAVLTFVLVVAGAAAYVLSVPTVLVVPAGRVFSESEAQTWARHFTVSGAGAHVVGAWTAFDGYGWPGLVVLNGTVEKPWPPPILFCPLEHSWTRFNGSIDVPVTTGPHTVYWTTGYCSDASKIVVTEPILIVYR